MGSELDKVVIENNNKFASTFNSDGLDIHPARKVVIITCMDCRLDPIAFCGFKVGEATVIRNAGAYAEDAARSVLLTTHVLGAEDIYIIKHTDCGLIGVSTEAGHSIIKKNLGLTESEDVDKFPILGIDNLEKSLEEEVEYMRKHPLLMKQIRVTGWIYDTDSGHLNKVVDS